MTESRKWFLLFAAAGTGWLVYLLSPILMPFAAGATLAYLSDPMADRLEKFGLRRTMAVLVVFLAWSVVLGLSLVLLIPALEDQIDHLIDDLPRLLRRIRSDLLPWLQTRFGISLRLRNLEDLTNLVSKHWDGAGGTASYALNSISRSGAVLLGWIANLFLIPVVTFYLLRDWDTLVAHLHDLLPRRYAPTVSRLAQEADSVLSAFMRGQLTVMLALAVIYGAGLWIIGLDLAFLVGFLAGLISFIPYAGAAVGIVTASVAAIIQYGDISSIVPVLGVFAVGQAAEGMILTPWLVGDRIGLHPVAVIFAVLAGGQLFGFLGVLLALPCASVVMVLVRHVHDLYKDSAFYAHIRHAGTGAEAAPFDHGPAD